MEHGIHDEVFEMMMASESPKPDAWDKFYDRVEGILKANNPDFIDLDGHEHEDGYSVDGALAAFKRGEGAASYADRVQGEIDLRKRIVAQRWEL